MFLILQPDSAANRESGTRSDPTETVVGSDLRTLHTEVYNPIRPASACRVGSGRPVCHQHYGYSDFSVDF